MKLPKHFTRMGTHISVMLQATKWSHYITRIINILEEGGYVERRSDKNKRKVFKIYLTQKAKDIFPKLAQVTSQYRKVMTSGIEDNELQICLRVLNKVLNNLLDKVEMSL